MCMLAHADCNGDETDNVQYEMFLMCNMKCLECAI